uniref:catalase family peroxidase n=1 Tax=Ningiella ruwaisensis TaxID=2364274 RepID=UPI00109EFC10|nr:catalase family peroxidase [Ningiella ruwaisensis]
MKIPSFTGLCATLSVCAITVGALSTAANAQQAPESVSANDFIALFEKLGGKHAGFRKAHAAGVCATATFVPNEQAKAYSNSVLFEQESVDAIVRFSIGGPNPLADERSSGTRGVGIQLNLPNGVKHNITGNNTPFFTGKDPETFFGFLQTLLPNEEGEVDRQATGAYIAANPSVQNALAWSQSHPLSTSYARDTYFGIHTFYMQDESGELTKFKWTLRPDLGEEHLEKSQTESLPEKYLEQRLLQDMEDSTVSFTLVATIGEDEDEALNPSIAWPEDRTELTLGRLTLNTAGGDSCKPINFDPNVLTTGFKASDDPVLKMRSPAYGISFGKRLSNQ